MAPIVGCDSLGGMIRALHAALPLLVTFSLAAWIRAQEKEVDEGPAAGHSGHGVAFNEGARQKAYLMQGCGDVRFPVTTDADVLRAGRRTTARLLALRS